MKKLLTVVAVAEAAMGVAFLTVPSLVGQLLFGAELTGTAMKFALTSTSQLMEGSGEHGRSPLRQCFMGW
jgi:hypothetical protein